MKYADLIRLTDLNQLEEEIGKSHKRLDFLLTYCFMSDDDLKLNGITVTWPDRILPVLELSKKKVNAKKQRVQEDVKTTTLQINVEIVEVFNSVSRFQDYGMMSETADYLSKIETIEGQVQSLGAQIAIINNEESLLEWEPSPFQKYRQIIDNLQPFKVLWETAALFQVEHAKWMSGPFLDIQPAAVDEVFSAISLIIG